MRSATFLLLGLLLTVTIMSLLYSIRSTTGTLSSLEDEIRPKHVVMIYQQFQYQNNTNCTEVQNTGNQLCEKMVWLDENTVGDKKVIQNLDSILNFGKERHVPYSCFINCSRIYRISKFSLEPKYNVFVVTGSRGVNTFFGVHALSIAAKQSTTPVRIVLVEVDSLPKYETLAVELGLDYLFLPKYISNLTGCCGLYPKSLAFNLAYLLFPEAHWNIFHDIDLVVPKSYFVLMENYLQSHSSLEWFYPYTGIADIKPDDAYNLFVQGISPSSPIMTEPNLGGSIVISTSLLKKIGGYDPEFFCGWAPEDFFIFYKLSFYQPIARVSGINFGHVNHEKPFMKGKYTRIPLQILDVFVSLTYEEKVKFFKFKGPLLNINTPCGYRYTLT